MKKLFFVLIALLLFFSFSYAKTFFPFGDIGTGIYSLAVYDGNLFTGQSDGTLGTYNGSSNVWSSLGDKGSALSALAVYDGNLFTGDDLGVLGTYKSGIWSSLGDIGGEIRTFVVHDGNLFTGQSDYPNGILGTYNSVSRIWSYLVTLGGYAIDEFAIYNDIIFYGTSAPGDLRFYITGAEDSRAYFVGEGAIRSLVVYDGNLFTGQDSPRGLGTYNSVINDDNVWSSLSNVGDGINSLAVYDGNLFTGQENGNLGTYYQGIWFFLEDTGAAINSLANYPIGDHNVIFIGQSDGILGYYPGTIDLNIFSIDNHTIYPVFNYNIDGNLTIRFSVFNKDNAAMTFDLNYGTTSEQGSGTIIANDMNLDSTICAQAQQWNNGSVDCYYDWNIAIIPDGNYYLKIEINDNDNNFFESTSKSMHIIQPYLHLQLFDENFGYLLISQVVSMNGINYLSDSQGKIDINIGGLIGQYVVSIGENENYPIRFFAFDLNILSKIDLNLFMLQDNNGLVVNFKFYDTDKTTVLANKLVKLKHGDNNISSMRYTNAGGETSFFLDPDDNYVFEIVKSESQVLRYYPVLLTISIPKNETTLANITPFDAKGSRLAQINWLNGSSAITYLIHSNTVNYYSFDFNASGYNPRNYLVSTKGDTATYTLQAYLAATTSGTETISGNYLFVVTDSISLNPIPNVLIKMKRNISGLGEIEIASLTTDSTGQATTSLQYYVEYNLYCYYDGVLVFTAAITPTPTPAYYQIQLSISTTRPAIPVIGLLSASFKPFNHNIFLNSLGWGDININISLLNKTLSTMKITIKDSGNRIISEKYFTALWADGNLVHFDLNLLDFNTDRRLIAIIDVNSTDGNSYRAEFGWTVFVEGQWAIMNLLSNFAGNNNKMALAFIVLFITLLAVGSACATSLIPGDPLLLSMLTLFILFFFVFIGFLDFIIVLFISLFVVFLAILTKAVM